MKRSSPPQRKPSCTVKSFGCCASCGSAAGPQLLPCLHSLCKHCIFLPGELKECPVCKEKFELREVTSNPLFPELSINPKESIKCQGCEDPSVTGWCVDCQEDLCSGCVAAHKRVKPARKHYIHTITPGSPRPPVCSAHKKELVNSYCLTCDQLVCRLCWPFHPKHLLQFSHEAVGLQRKQIQKMVQKVQKKRLSVQRDLKDLEERLSDLEELQTRMKIKVKETVVRLCNVMVNKAAKLSKEIKDLCGQEREKLSERRSLLQRLEKKLDHVLTFTDKAMTCQPHTVLLSCKRQIHHQLQDMLDQVVSPIASLTELSFHTNEDNIRNVLKTFGSIVAKDVPYGCSKIRNAAEPSLDLLTANEILRSPTLTCPKPSHPTLLPPTPGSPPQKDPQSSKKRLVCDRALLKKVHRCPSHHSLSFSASQNVKYSKFPNKRQAWSYQPYYPRGNPQRSVVSRTPPKSRQELLQSTEATSSQLTKPASSSLHASASVTPVSVRQISAPVSSTSMFACYEQNRDVACLRGLQEIKGLTPEQQTSNIYPAENDRDIPNGNILSVVKVLDNSSVPTSDARVPAGVWERNKVKVESTCTDVSVRGLLVSENFFVFSPLEKTADRAASLQTAKGSLFHRFDPLNGSGGSLFGTSEGSNRTCMLKHDQESPDRYIKTEINEVPEMAQEFTQTTLPVMENLAVTDLRKSYSSALKKEEEDAKPVIKIRDDEGNLVVMEPLGRDWLPKVSVSRLPIPDFLSSSPTPACRVVWREESSSFDLSVVKDEPSPVLPPRFTDQPVLVSKLYCAACRVRGKLFQCCVCQRAFHRECHLPPVSQTRGEQWQCLLCWDLGQAKDLARYPQSACSSHLSLHDQKKCEYLLLFLSCCKGSSALYGPVKLRSQTRYVDMTLVRGRLLRKLTPPYLTPEEFVSDVWLLLHTLLNSSKEVQPVKQLQRFFSKELMRVFGPSMHPSFLKDPFSGNQEERGGRRT